MPGKSLLKKINTGSILLIICAFAIAVSAEYWFARTQSTKAQQKQLEQKLNLLSQSLQGPLWSLDEPTISLMGDAYMAGTDVVSLSIYAQHHPDALFHKEKENDAPTLFGQKQITYKEQVIGSARIGLSSAPYTESLSRNLLYGLGLASFIALALTIVLKLLFRKFLGNPLEALGAWSDRVAAGEFGAPPPEINLEELHSLADKFANMSEKIQSREHALQSSEKKFRSLFENSEVSIWNEDLTATLAVLNSLRRQGVTDLQRHLKKNPDIARELIAGAKIIQVNEAALKLFDAKNKAEIVQQIDKAFTPDANEIFKQQLYALWNREASCRTEATLHLPSGKTRQTIISFPFPETEEGFQSIPVSIFDITELKRAEQALRESEIRFRLIFETNPDPIILAWLENGSIIDANSAFEAATGVSRQQALGKNSAELGFWADTSLRDSFREQLSLRGELNNFEARFRVKGGEVKTGLLSARMFTLGGKATILLVIRDITSEKAAEQILIEMDRMKSEFISTAAHELRTPLSAMLGYTELLLSPDQFGAFSEEQTRDFLNEVYDRGQSLNRIIDDLLDISRIESGQPVTLDLQSADLLDLLKKTVRFFQSQAPARNFRLDLPNPPIDSMVVIDRHRIMQVLENILSNAIKYSPAGGEIALQCQPTPKGWEVRVADRGIGMTAEQIDRVFDKFYRADASNTAAGGLGLGMSIARQIIEAHGGDIQVESTQGEGTTVILHLP